MVGSGLGRLCAKPENIDVCEKTMMNMNDAFDCRPENCTINLMNIHGKIARKFENLSVFEDRKESGMPRSGLVGRRNMGSFRSDERMDPLNFFSRSSGFGYGRRKDWDEFETVECNGEDRGGGQYLRFMDQSGNTNERVSLNRRTRMPNYEPYVSENLNTGVNRASKSHFRGGLDQLSSVHKQETGGNRFYPPQHTAQDHRSGDHPLILSSHDPRWRSDLDSEVDGFAPRMHLHSVRKRCCPIAGCAPFFTCCNCFELLMLPKKHLNQNSDRMKLRCGGCFKLVVFTFSSHCKNDDSGSEFQHVHGPSTGQGSDKTCTNSGRHNFTPTYGCEDPKKDSSSVFLETEDEGGSSGDNTHISTIDLTPATEIDIPPYEYTNTTGTTFASKKDGGSTVNLFRDSNGPSKANVTINGNPVHDRLIRRAEKLAGRIEPGHYWYDIRAGFWGVMGGSCIGIIPPGITEFNYLMPENCSAGNTAVFVNGRELSQKDLNVLGQRGLPSARDRSYIVEISGRVLDADTGAQLLDLGKLAPSLERSKRGYGMKDPNAAAVDF